MAERTAKRPAGVTRLPRQPAATSASGFDLSQFTTAELQRVAADRDLDTTGSDAVLRARILADLEV